MDKSKPNQSNMKQITEAMLNVMKAISNIEKNKVVGEGRNAYKGVEDRDVKVAIRTAMMDNGLIIIPISIEPTIKVDRWEEVYQGQAKAKQSVLTEVRTKYRIIHISGESLDIEGYGHGQDSQDKSAGKATTYALKYALLYTFLIPTGDIDDADTTHLQQISTPAPADDDKPWLSDKHEKWEKAVSYVSANGPDSVPTAIRTLERDFKINKAMRAALLTIAKGVASVQQ